RRHAAGEDPRPGPHPGELDAPPGRPRSRRGGGLGGRAGRRSRGDRAARPVRHRRPVASRADGGERAAAALRRAGRGRAGGRALNGSRTRLRGDDHIAEQGDTTCVLVLAGLDPSGSAGLLAQARLPAVVDPVLAASSGAALFQGGSGAARDAYAALWPHAVITPNAVEAQLLLDLPDAPRDAAALERAARELVRRGAKGALVKGGHAAGPESVDVLCFEDRCEHLSA